MSDSAGEAAASFSWTRRHVLTLVVLCLAALLDTVDVTVVNVAMPAIRESLRLSERGLSWMVNAYMVPFGGFLLLGGRAGDLLGRRRVLVAGTAVFALAPLGWAPAPPAGGVGGPRAGAGAVGRGDGRRPGGRGARGRVRGADDAGPAQLRVPGRAGPQPGVRGLGRGVGRGRDARAGAQRGARQLGRRAGDLLRQDAN